MSIDAVLEPEISVTGYHSLLFDIAEKVDLPAEYLGSDVKNMLIGIIEHGKVNTAIDAFFETLEGKFRYQTRTFIKLTAREYREDIKLQETVLDTMFSTGHFIQDPEATKIPAILAADYAVRDLREAAGILLPYVRIAARRSNDFAKVRNVVASLRSQPVLALAEKTKGSPPVSRACMYSIGRAALDYPSDVVDDVARKLMGNEFDEIAKAYDDCSETSQDIMMSIGTIVYLTRGGRGLAALAIGAVKNKDHPQQVLRFLRERYIGHLKGEISGGKFSTECADFYSGYKSAGV